MLKLNLHLEIVICMRANHTLVRPSSSKICVELFWIRRKFPGSQQRPNYICHPPRLNIDWPINHSYAKRRSLVDA
jgi:hypothetical protein